MAPAKSPQSPWWVSATERIGVPTAFLAVVLYGGYLLLKPIAEEHVETVRQQRQILGEMREMISTDREEAKRRTGLLQALLEEQARTSKEQIRTVELLEGISRMPE